MYVYMYTCIHVYMYICIRNDGCWCPGIHTALVCVKLGGAFGAKQQIINITIHEQNQQFRLDETYDSAYLLKAC